MENNEKEFYFMKKEINEINCLFKNIVINIRTGNYSDAGSKMNSCLQVLQPLLTSGIIPPTQIKSMVYSLETMLMMQEQKDWVAVADVIEFEFLVLLEKVC